MIPLVRVLLAGDVNLQARRAPASAFEHLVDVMGRADLRIVNLEGLLVVTSEDPMAPDIPHKPNWRHSGPEMADALSAAGIEMVSCANNVSFPPAALLQSLAVLDRAGIAHAGAGSDDAAAHAPAIVERDGVRIGLLAYSSITYPFGHAAESGRPGIAALRAHTAYVPDPRSAEVPGRPPVVRTMPHPQDLQRMAVDVQEARGACDALIVSVHWGLPGEALCDYQIALAHAAVNAGADAIMGHGPHSVQGVEVYRATHFLQSWQPRLRLARHARPPHHRPACHMPPRRRLHEPR